MSAADVSSHRVQPATCGGNFGCACGRVCATTNRREWNRNYHRTDQYGLCGNSADARALLRRRRGYHGATQTLRSLTHRAQEYANGLNNTSDETGSILVTLFSMLAGAETGLQWLPLRFPGNVRVVVTATNPDASYLQLHEQKIQQHMTNPHQPPVRQHITVGGSSTTGNDHPVRQEAGEAEYESSHRRRKVLLPTTK